MKALIRNKTMCWKEQPQATLEALIVPVLKAVNAKYEETKLAYNQLTKSQRMERIRHATSLEAVVMCVVSENQK